MPKLFLTETYASYIKYLSGLPLYSLCELRSSPLQPLRLEFNASTAEYAEIKTQSAQREEKGYYSYCPYSIAASVIALRFSGGMFAITRQPGRSTKQALCFLRIAKFACGVLKRPVLRSSESEVGVACDLRAQRRICFLRSNYAKKLRRTRRRTQTTKLRHSRLI